jgi:hypothetical protein
LFKTIFRFAVNLELLARLCRESSPPFDGSAVADIAWSATVASSFHNSLAIDANAMVDPFNSRLGQVLAHVRTTKM